jgi:UDP-perosamine 4-acetyltransferase
MEKLILLGAGGHARSVMDLLLQNDEYDVVGCLDPAPGAVLGIPVIGNDDQLDILFSKGIKKAFIAIGNNRLREKLFGRAQFIGFEIINIISRSATISPRASLGSGICVMAGAVLNVNTRIGDNCIINTRCSIDHDCTIGRSVHIAPGVTLSGSVKVGDGAHIGTGTAVIDGITIGEWAYVGGGAAVVKDIPAYTLAYGVPAKAVRNL